MIDSGHAIPDTTVPALRGVDISRAVWAGLHVVGRCARRVCAGADYELARCDAPALLVEESRISGLRQINEDPSMSKPRISGTYRGVHN